ncbi:DUF2939 domain-containing protein [Lysobacter firmicutimachus]|uniref:DUF2939 domain-containing protein n=1 Tax=Lysobacter firmicutimachus TaxID=1792846 RepID=A0AAU8MQ74_9GAMM|nr:DUF2939 domain-containing protein [Lysobacter antibioticus]
MKKWIAALALVLALLLGYVAAGPFLTVRAIRAAVKEGNPGELSKHVDFAAIRLSLKAQVNDYLVRRAGPEVQSNPFGAIGLSLAGSVAGTAVDAIATPMGIGAVLEGRKLLRRVDGSAADRDAYAPVAPAEPLKKLSYRFESPSRFTATVANADGDPVVFVLTRDGLNWTVTDVRVPLERMLP